MSLRINTNLTSLSVQKDVEKNDKELGKALNHLASGTRISNAAEDAAGLAIAENMKAEAASLTQASRNSQDAMGFVQVAEGSLNEISNILIRLRELSIQAASDTVSDHERSFIDKEYQTLKDEITRIADSTRFGGVPLLNGDSPKSELSFQVGTQDTSSDRIELDINNFNSTASAIGLSGTGTRDIDDARDALESLDEALSIVSGHRASLGAMQNRLNSTTNSLEVAIEGVKAAESRIRDADVAQEAAEAAKRSILKQAAVSVLAQANQEPILALKLI